MIVISLWQPLTAIIRYLRYKKEAGVLIQNSMIIRGLKLLGEFHKEYSSKDILKKRGGGVSNIPANKLFEI